ncbi:MAG: TonB-dependent receptor [Flavobacteriales bacterium]|nr:TonB-dependent receptor [Flavobacteriales bacterium]
MKQILTLCALLLVFSSSAQTITQTVKGTVIDKQSQFPIPGAKIQVIGADPIKAAITDANGEFIIEEVPVGRISLQIKFVGYEDAILKDLILKSGKELEVNVGLEESIAVLTKVDVVARQDKKETINKMASVSARTISTEEAGKFAGTLNDPARMAQNYAGVSGASDDRNDIIIRGNSPLGVLWRMEGIDIPSPNHFSTLGTTGGPVSMLNINNLANSDFMTSAWSANYGNALSGVFDLRLRNGNSNKREYLAQVGFNGFEFGAEGPFKKGSRPSYLANYRYSTLGVMSALGIDLGVGAAVPQYQDLTFKLNFPTKKAGKFSVWGIGGFSYIEFEATGEADSTNLYASSDQSSRFESRTGVVGASHKYFFNKNTFYELIIAASASQTTGTIDSLDESGVETKLFGFDREQLKYSANLKFNRKINKKNTVTLGVIGENYVTSILDTVWTGTDYRTVADNEGNAVLLQSYLNYQYRFNQKLTMNAGLHSQHFLLSESHAIEPRLGFRYKANNRNTFSLGSGMHSQLQPITVYFNEYVNDEGEVELPNSKLDFNKSIHSVIGHEFLISENTRIKTEVYHQYVYNVPVDTFASTFSMINEGAGFTLPSGGGFENTGTGYNYGVELTLEKFYSKGYYFLFTTSLFESKYKGSDGILRNTAFNSNYVFNLLGGKEFKLGKKNVLGFDSRVTLTGGKRYTPIDLENSILYDTEIRLVNEAFEAQHNPYFRFDFKVTLKTNWKKVSQEFSVDLQNLTNQQNIFQEGYNRQTKDISYVYQRGFFPNVQYKLNF